MSDSEHDDEFEAYLKRRTPIHKGVAPPEHLEPPPELDRIIIGNARKAIQGAAPMHLYRAPKWALPVALAATIVISCAVVLELGLRAKHQEAGQAQERIDPEIVAEAPQVVAAPAAATALPETPETGVNGSHAAAQSTATGHSGAAPKVAANASAKGHARLRLPPIPTVPWPPAATPSTPTVADAAPQDEKVRTRLARAEVAASRSRTDSESSEQIAPQSSATAVQNAPPAAPITNAEPNSSTAPPPVAYAPARSPSADAPAATLEEIVVTGPSPSARHARADRLDPATWLGQIERLRSAGRVAEAEREIKRFREAYPAYPPPAAAAADARAQ